MHKLRSLLASGLILSGSIAVPVRARAQTAPTTSNKAVAGSLDGEAAVKSLYNGYIKAFNKKDVDAIMAVYSPDIFVFDLAPPREYPTWAAYKKDWQDLFDAFPGPIAVSLAELKITVAGSVAYTHCVNDVTLTAKDGSKEHIVVRVTDVLRKQNGKWLIVLEHISVPVDPVTGKSDLLSKP